MVYYVIVDLALHVLSLAWNIHVLVHIGINVNKLSDKQTGP